MSFALPGNGETEIPGRSRAREAPWREAPFAPVDCLPTWPLAHMVPTRKEMRRTLPPGVGRVLRLAESRVPGSGERALQIVDASLLLETPSGTLEVWGEEGLPT